MTQRHGLRSGLTGQLHFLKARLLPLQGPGLTVPGLEGGAGAAGFCDEAVPEAPSPRAVGEEGSRGGQAGRRPRAPGRWAPRPQAPGTAWRTGRPSQCQARPGHRDLWRLVFRGCRTAAARG